MNKMQTQTAKFAIIGEYPVPVTLVPLSLLNTQIVLPNSTKCTYQEYLEKRLTWLLEEMAELAESIKSKDLINAYRELADILYVTFGTAVALGIDIEKVFEEIHKANMTKLYLKTVREDGKIIKPEGFIGSDIQKIVDSQTDKILYYSIT